MRNYRGKFSSYKAVVMKKLYEGDLVASRTSKVVTATSSRRFLFIYIVGRNSGFRQSHLN